MGRIVKIFLSVVSTLILAGIVLPVALSLLLNLPSVQNFAVRHAARWASARLGTTVAIDRVHLRLFNNVAVDGFYVEDYAGDTLMYCKKVRVPVTRLDIFSGRFALGRVAVNRVDLFLSQDSTGTMNIKRVLEHLKSNRKKEKKGGFRMAAASLALDSVHFKMRKWERKEREGVNFTDLDVRDFALHASGISVADDSVALSIEHLAFREKGGFELERLTAGDFAISGRGMYFNRLGVRASGSDLRMNYLYFVYPTWKAYKDFLSDVRLEADMAGSTVSYETIGCFAPKLRSWRSVYRNVSLAVSGPIRALEGVIRNLELEDTRLAADFGIYNVPDVERMRLRIGVSHLSTTAEDAALVVHDVTRGRSLGKAGEMLGRLGRIEFEGNFDGLFRRFRADGRFTTGLGGVAVDLEAGDGERGTMGLKGTVGLDGFDVGRLVGVPDLGRVTMDAKASGGVGRGDFYADAQTHIASVAFNGYTYRNIDVNGLFGDRTFMGYIGSRDPNLRLAWNGECDFRGAEPVYDFDLDLDHADLYALNINRRDTVSVLSCRVRAHGSGTKLDDIDGQINVRDLLYVNPVDSVRTGEIRFVGTNTEESKLLGMYSSFADVEMRGRLSYGNIIGYFRNTLAGYLPSLAERGTAAPAPTAEQEMSRLVAEGYEMKPASDASNYYLLRANVKQANNVAGIFVPGLQVAEGTQLSFLFNPVADRFSLSLTSEYIERGGFFVSNLNVNTRNVADSISLYMRADDLFTGSVYMPNLSVVGGVKENKITVQTKSSDPERENYMLIGLTAALGRNAVSGIPQVSLRFLPSTIAHGSQEWRIGARGIVYDSTRIVVDGFRISSGEQELAVSGVASRSRADTLRLVMRDFDLAPLAQLASRAGYSVEGRSNGYVDMTSALREGLLQARVNFDSVRVNGIPMPETVFDSRWDFHTERAAFLLTKQGEGRDTLVRGYYSPARKAYMADVRMQGIELALLEPVLQGIMKNTRGVADAELRLAGSGPHPSLSGVVRVPRMETTVDFTNVPYTLADAEIEVKDNVFTLKPTRVYDTKGHSAAIGMSIGSQYFKNFWYDVRIRPENLMAINTTEQDNELFYGTVYASGAVDVKGDKLGTKIDIVATTEPSSAFYMPLSDKESIAEADFIFVENPEEPVDTTTVAMRKRMMFERRMKRRSAARGDMEINMVVNVRPNTDFQLVVDPRSGDMIKARGDGALTLHVNPRNNEFSMYGDYQLTDGSYRFSLVNLIERTFEIEPGSSIQWTGDPIDAQLNITALYKLKASLAPLLMSNDENMKRRVPVDCMIHLGDRLSQPAITFDVTVPNTDPETQSLVNSALNTQEMKATQIIWLLAFNSFYADNTSTSQNLNIGSVGSSATGFEFLSNQLSNWISTDKYNIGLRYRPKSEVTSDELEFGFSTDIIGNRLLLEVEGNYDFGNNATMTNRTANNLTGDFYLTWLIDQAGNLKAKAFTRTIDRFDENQGLQESGLGIYYKEDFNTVGDIVRNIRARMAGRSERRRARREERAQRDAAKAAAALPAGERSGAADEAGATSDAAPGAEE